MLTPMEFSIERPILPLTICFGERGKSVFQCQISLDLTPNKTSGGDIEAKLTLRGNHVFQQFRGLGVIG